MWCKQKSVRELPVPEEKTLVEWPAQAPAKGVELPLAAESPLATAIVEGQKNPYVLFY